MSLVKVLASSSKNKSTFSFVCLGISSFIQQKFIEHFMTEKIILNGKVITLRRKKKKWDPCPDGACNPIEDLDRQIVIYSKCYHVNNCKN